MIELTQVHLENEMDLILAHKQSMKLCELAGLSLSLQTTFATAISEVSRSILDRSDDAVLSLNLTEKQEREKYIIAVIRDNRKNNISSNDEGYANASKLVSNIQLGEDDQSQVELRFRIPATTSVSDVTIERWRIHLNNDPQVSPYEEIKRKNKQLLEIAEMLRTSEARYKQLADTLPIFIFSLDKQGSVSYINKWMSDFTSQTAEQVNASQWADFIHPEDIGIFSRFRENGPYTNVDIEARLKHAGSGDYHWHSGVASPVLDEEQNVVVWNAFMADVQVLKENAELKEAQAALKENIEQLNRSNRQLEQFAYVASHDLQEPLRKIGFYSDILKHKYGATLDGEGKTYLDSLLRSTERMRQLVIDILKFSTISDQPVFTAVSLQEVAQEAIQDLELAIRDARAEIKVGELPGITGNQLQLRLLFENLLSNSIKYVAEEQIPRIEIAAEVSGSSIKLHFSDNGIGFDEQYLNKMFDLFQRLHSREKFSGTGIGLTICKRVAEVHGGSITAASKPGAGAVFTVTLPVTQAL